MAERFAATVEMASVEKEAIRKLHSLSECCICLMTFTDPRMLPCLHSACLKCFEDIQFKNGKRPGDNLPCPLCRNEFSIPADGMKGLQKNFFIESLIEVTSSFNLEEKSRPCMLCSIVDEGKDVAEATMRCLNCRENYCLRCSKIHKTLQGSRDHKIVELKMECDEEEIRNMFPIRKCVTHSDRVLDYYCFDCKSLVCVSCFVEVHKTHGCKDVTTVDKEFRQRIEQTFKVIDSHKEGILSRKSELEGQKREFLAKAMETESTIKKKNEQLKALIDQHTKEVLNELLLLKQQQEKKMETEIEEIERKLAVLESFVTYCIELKSKGSPSEVCGNVDRLLTRAKELSKENDEYLRSQCESYDFEFIDTDHKALLQKATNLIGKLSELTKESSSCAIVIGRSSRISTSHGFLKINLNRPEDVSTLEPFPTEIIWGAPSAVYHNSLFLSGIGNKYQEIWRLDVSSNTSSSCKWSKCASLILGRLFHSVAFVDHVLFICGGWSGFPLETLNDVEAYNTSDDKCSRVGTLAYAVKCSGNCVSWKSSLYIFGGYENQMLPIGKIQVYDTKLNTCTLLSKQMPRPCSLLSGVLCENSVILLDKDGCFVYNFDTQTWKMRDKFKFENVAIGVTADDGKIFVIGGGGVKNYDIRWIPIANILKDEFIEWRHHAKLPDNYFEDVYTIGKLDFNV